MKQKFCLNSIALFKDINNSQTNRSTTKQTYSFNKSPRFQTFQPYCRKSTYGGDNIKRKDSGTYIGFGKRSDFTKCLSISPSSSKYNLKTCFQQTKRKGRSIGLGRDEVIFDSYINKQGLKTPGSTKYNNQKLDKLKSPIFSIRKKTKMTDRTMTIQPQNNNPGPGAYNNPQIDINSSNYASKFQRISFSASKGIRFNSSDNKVPGPGKYNELSNLSAVGKYIVSRYQGGTIAKFNKNKKVSNFQFIAKQASQKPGPGYYKMPSQFGQYDGNIYNTSQNQIIPSKSYKTSRK